MTYTAFEGWDNMRIGLTSISMADLKKIEAELRERLEKFVGERIDAAKQEIIEAVLTSINGALGAPAPAAFRACKKPACEVPKPHRWHRGPFKP